MDNQNTIAPKVKITPVDFFLYAGFVIALIATVVSFINLNFDALARIFPDPLNRYYTSTGNMQTALAFLFIAYPVTAVLAVVLRKSINKNPEKSHLALRKWVLYGILFISGLIALGDIITLIRYFLMGDLGQLFVCKILVVLLVSIVLFVYFIHQLTYDNVWSKKSVKVFEWVSVVLFILAIVFGFIMMGSPKKQRQIRFDDQRTGDLQSIQYQVINYFQQYGKLPTDLKALADPLSSYAIPFDPSLDPIKNYEYVLAKEKNTFALCGSFDLSTDDANQYKDAYSGGNYYTTGVMKDVSISARPPSSDLGFDNWSHDAGKYCFTRTIDPIRYPLYYKN